MSFTLTGSLRKKEIVRGIANTLAYWPRIEGKLVTATSPTVTIYDPGGASITSPAAAVGVDEGITFSWTPAATLAFDEDYYFEVTFTDDASKVRKDKEYFDLVRIPLHCPIDQNYLEMLEPKLRTWLDGNGLGTSDDAAQRFIIIAWDDIVSRIRAAGFRPALITDRYAFARAAAFRAIMRILETQVRTGNSDHWKDKIDRYTKYYEEAWAGIGKVKFEDIDQGGAPVGEATPAQVRFRL